MRILDVVHDSGDRYHKHILIEEGGSFSILDQVAGHAPITAMQRLPESSAMQLWHRLLVSAFVAVTHNANDSEILAQRRLAMLH